MNIDTDRALQFHYSAINYCRYVVMFCCTVFVSFTLGKKRHGKYVCCTYHWLNGLYDLVERISRTKSLIVLPLLQKLLAKSFYSVLLCNLQFFVCVFANILVSNVNFVIAVINNLLVHTFYFKIFRSIIWMKNTIRFLLYIFVEFTWSFVFLLDNITNAIVCPTWGFS